MSDLQDGYKRIFTENPSDYYGGETERHVQDILRYRTGGSVLEIGAGEGRNALFLARHGFAVTAQDISEASIKKLQERAREQGVVVKTMVSDARLLEHRDTIDVVVSTFMLHLLPSQEALHLIRHLQEKTTIYGLHAISAITRQGDFFRANPARDRFYPELGTLQELYVGWEILSYIEEEREARQERPDGSSMKNISAHLLARKTVP